MSAQRYSIAWPPYTEQRRRDGFQRDDGVPVDADFTQSSLRPRKPLPRVSVDHTYSMFACLAMHTARAIDSMSGSVVCTNMAKELSAQVTCEWSSKICAHSQMLTWWRRGEMGVADGNFQ